MNTTFIYKDKWRLTYPQRIPPIKICQLIYISQLIIECVKRLHKQLNISIMQQKAKVGQTI